MARILSVSYDEPLLRSRQMLLQEEGHDVVSALGYTEAMKLCKTASGFHVFGSVNTWIVFIGAVAPGLGGRCQVPLVQLHCPLIHE